MTDDTFPDGTVWLITKRYSGSEKPYTYVVARINGAWWITGNTKSYTWTEILRWMSWGTIVSAKTALDFTTVVVDGQTLAA